MKKFWNWNTDDDTGRILTIDGTIAEESWFDDDITPKLFKNELASGKGNVTLWLNSPGGDCVAASQIYAMLMDYAGQVHVNIDGIAASAASVIAMAGTTVNMAPTALMMIHNPFTIAMGDTDEMERAIAMLSEVKESIINAYELKTGLSRTQLSHLMDAETWMNAGKAIELGFADSILTDSDSKQMHDAASMGSYSFSRRQVTNALLNKAIAKKFSEVCVGHLGKETDVVTLPIQHDSAAELAQPLDVKDWKKGECDLIPGVTAPHIMTVERDYPATYERFTSIGPLMEKIGNGGKGIAWNTQSEMDLLRKLNYTKAEGPAKGQPMLNTAIDAAEMILTLAPETNGQVAVKAWAALSEFTGRDHTHLALNKEDEKIRFRDIQAQPRKIISSPTWSGLEDEHVSYNAGYTNVHELIPWRTLSGRQQLYQDHQWMRDFGESLLVYRPPIDTRSVKEVMGQKSNGNPEKALNFLTPHQKWGIHSTYSDNLLMLTLGRGGPVVWLSEADAKELGIADNDWIEVFNSNGALTARAVVSQRVPAGMTMMYHAQERIVNLPGSEITQQRGGIHNSVTRITPKPTHMIGGYAHLAYGFNYYGTVGSNRDEFVVVRKMKNIDWLDGEGNDQVQESVK